ncbi:MAG TPA: sigma-70 family RNA polymerase sigma factor [Gemmatimonadaceae bacterium]|jgi:RNA polymerase sigma-70 factor (ECF subfamily)|nr:sigma-70 family RNA polymerase sigma factor [Gemmatimonadaceae bacterium]
MAERITEEQLRRIYGDTIDALYGYVSRRCGGVRQLAEDVTQEVWLRAVHDWRRNGAPDKPIAWLTTVARNLILNHVRRREGIALDALSPMQILDALDNDTAAESAEIAMAVNEALTRMPQAEARLLESFHYDHCRMSQLAQAYGVSERAIEGRLRRARQRLRRELEITLESERGMA